MTTKNPTVGKTVDTVICFRTGRIVHGVIQTSFVGAESQPLVISLAKKMLKQVDLTFAGKPIEKDEEPPEDGG